MPKTNTWHSVSQTSLMSSSDINQQLSVHSSTSSYSDGTIQNLSVSGASKVTFGGAYGSTSALGWESVDGKNVFAIAQAIDGTTLFSGSRIRLPISFYQYATYEINSGTNFSSACDITVSLQGAQSIGGTYYPDGNSSFSLEITKEVINALQSSSWDDGNELVASDFYTLANSLIPSSTLATSTTASYAITTSFAASIAVLDIANFVSTGGEFVLTSGVNVVTLSYTGIDATNSLLLGCAFEYGVTGTYPIGSSITIISAATTQYVNAETYVVVTNTQTSSNGNNAVYFAQYLTGEIGQWSTGSPLPEDNVAITFAPSSGTLYAIGPSGAVYAASFPQDGTMGTWSAVSLSKTIGSTLQAFALPSYNLSSSDACPTISVYTVNSTDYVFILGGITNGVQQYNGWYFQLNDNGSALPVISTTTLPFATSDGTSYQQSGIFSFFANNCIYARDTTSIFYLTLYSLNCWIDNIGVFNTGQWVCVVSQYANSLYADIAGDGADDYQTILGVAYGNVITNTSIISLTPEGYGVSDNFTSIPAFFNGVNAYDAIGNSIVFENDDGTATLLSNYDYGCWLYPTTWLDIPISSSASGKFLVITATGTARTNFGVNVALQDTRVYNGGANESANLYYTFPQAVVLTQNGWQTIQTYTGLSGNAYSMLRFSLYSQASQQFPNFIGFLEENTTRWSTLKYNLPNSLLLYATDVTYDTAGVNNTSSITVLQYDGLGGKNNQPNAILSTTLEIA